MSLSTRHIVASSQGMHHGYGIHLSIHAEQIFLNFQHNVSSWISVVFVENCGHPEYYFCTIESVLSETN